MTKKELYDRLIQNNIREDSYSLDGGLPNEAYCLEEVNGEWQTYYSERGGKSGVEKFSSENDACNDFFKTVINDPDMIEK